MYIRIVARAIPKRWKNGRSWGLLAGVILFFILLRVTVPLACPFKTYLGVPCPFCGLTTGSALCARGRLAEAYQSNILSPVVVLFVLLAGAYTVGSRLFAGYALKVQMAPGLSRALWILAAMAVAASWARTLVRATGRSPLF